MKQDPCKKFACAIQRCLVENDFQEVRCDKVFEAMRKCCVKFKPLNSSLVCEGYDLEPRKYAQVTDRPAK